MPSNHSTRNAKPTKPMALNLETLNLATYQLP